MFVAFSRFSRRARLTHTQYKQNQKQFDHAFRVFTYFNGKITQGVEKETMAIFNGAESTTSDNKRLMSQLERVFNLMSDSKYRTLKEISKAVHAPEASVSATLRCLRRVKFGSHAVNRRARGDRKNGLYEYQLVLNPH